MRRFLPLALGCTATFVNVTAFGFFMAWLAETDFMFGHFKGEPEYLISALVLSLIGAVATIAWIGTTIYARFRREHSSARPGMALRIFGSLGVLAMAAPAILIIPIGVTEWPDAQRTMRRHAVSRVVSVEREAPNVPKLTAKLVRALDDENFYVRNAASNSLSQLPLVDPSAIPKLIEVALRREELTSLYAVHTLQNFGEDAAGAVPALIELLNADIVLRLAAGEALAAIGRPAMVPVIEASRSKDPNVRAAAAVLLGQFATRDVESSMRIVDMVDDPDPGVRKSVIASLGSVARFAREGLDRALEDPDPEVRAAAERTLRDLADSSENKIRVARLDLSSPYANNRVNAALALGSHGAAASSALPELHAALSDPELRVRVAAAKAIWLITGESRE